jgi:predicted glycoside hydrolase/deacetylase ChbG (UPF0249 family)
MARKKTDESPMKHILVINADDGGMDSSTDRAILRCAEAGGVTSVSVVARGATAENFVAQARELGLGIGLHLNLTEGRSKSPIEGLTDENGRFALGKENSWTQLQNCAPDPVALEAEILSQWTALLDFGVKPDHINGHNHVQVFPFVAELIERALGAQLKPLHVRVPRENAAPTAVLGRFPAPIAHPAEFLSRHRIPLFVGHAFSEDVSWSSLVDLQDVPEGAAEWMVHPGSRDGSDFTSSPNRDLETAFLCSPNLTDRLKKWGWSLGRFGDCT